MDIASQTIPRIDSGIVIVDNAINSTLPPPLVGESVNLLQIWITIGSYVWLLGVAIFAVYAIASYVFLKMKMRHATCIKENIYESQNTKSPFVIGVFSPKIYLPSNLSEKEMMFIVLHEKAHIKRCDHIIKFVAYLTLCLHWFNPLVWVAFWLMGKDMEMSCDERVLKELGAETKSDYSRTLLSLATERHFMGASPLAFGEVGVKARIKNILNFKKPAFWAVAIATVAVITISIGLISNPKSDDKNAKVGTLVKNKIMASAALDNGFDIQLILLDGRTFTDKDVPIGGNIYTINFTGEYELQVLKDGKIISIMPNEQLLTNSFDGVSLNFSSEFEFEINDYNGDGNPDFTIGQWSGSSNNLHEIYSVAKGGKITKLTKEGGIYTSDGKNASDFSIQLALEDNGRLRAAQYDIEQGKIITVYYNWNEETGVFEPATPVTLTKETATEFINQTLSTFTVNSDNTVSFKLPAVIPTDEGGKVKLVISSSATFPSSIQEILDYKEGWQGGESHSHQLDMSKGNPEEIFLRVAFITEEDETSFEIHTADYLKLIAPFEYDTPVNVVDRNVEVNQTGTFGVLKYTMKNGDNFSITLTPPKGVTLSTIKSESENGFMLFSEMPTVVISKDTAQIGMLTLSSFGTSNKDYLTEISTSDNTLPMAIYSPIAMANHATFDNYKVCKSSATGANATAKYLWQDLTDYSGRAPEAPWLEEDAILAYDYEKIPFFIYMNLAKDSLSSAELDALAKSIEIKT